MQTWIWRHFHMQHPDEWEMLHYCCDPAVGRCALADRYRFRLEFHWRRFAVRPDLDRILTDYRQQLEGKASEQGAAVRSVRHGAWQGLEKVSGGVLTWRFGRFFSVESCLVELVFVWPDDPDEPLAHDILDSVREEPARGEVRRWRVFGMDMGVSADFTARQCTIEPARAEMVFGPVKPSVRRETFQRLGMVEQWLAGTIADWLDTQRPATAKGWRTGRRQRANHSICVATAAVPATGVKRLLRRPGSFQAAAWICPADKRLYSVMSASGEPPTEQPETLAGGRLACCDDLAAQR